jgi:hypothetical protein
LRDRCNAEKHAGDQRGKANGLAHVILQWEPACGRCSW